MADTAIFINTSREFDNAGLISVAQRADDLGYHSLWTGESWGRDAFTVLTMLACHTQRLRLGTGIVTVFSRSPALIAQSIASLDLVSEGRAILGLGTSGRIVIEDWHGVPYRKPVARTREYVQIIRQALSGNAVNHQGDLFNLARFRIGAPPIQKKLPIYLASLGPKNLELTGQVADGWLPVWVGRNQLAAFTEDVAKAASAAGRDISEITVAPQILCWSAETSEQLEEGERLIRAQMAYYIGGMGTYYHSLFCRNGYAAEADAVRDAWAAGDRAKAADSISTKMLDDVTVLGTSAECRKKLEDYRSSGADMPIIALPHGSLMPDTLRALEALAPEALTQQSVPATIQQQTTVPGNSE